LKEQDHFEDLGIIGRSYQNRSWGNRVGGCILDASSSGQGPMAASCEHVNKPSGSIKGGVFLD